MKFYFFLLFLFLNWNVIAQDNKSDIQYPSYKVSFGSFIQHLEPAIEGKYYIQHFGNQFVSVSIKALKKTYISVGTGLNSYGDRLFLMGVNHVWHSFSPKLFLEGDYAYAGEFFFDAFNDAGNQGVYNSFKEATGLGWVPMIYHGVNYKFFRSLSLRCGIIAPTLIMVTLEVSML